jgi:hypothetical protein
VVTFNLDIERNADVREDFSLQGDVHNLRTLWVDNPTILISTVNSDALRLVILGNDLILSLEGIIIDNLNAPCFGVSEEALIVFKEISW